MPLTPDEENILQSITVGSYNDPFRPEFPPHGPRFPASPTFQIEIPGFSNVWLKDESVHRYSGTHKDRLAWEVVILYRDFLLAKKMGRLKKDLPVFSMISSGSAALAVSRSLEAYGLPRLKVLVDESLGSDIRNALEGSHCILYQAELKERSLKPIEILTLTDNLDGFDLTSNQGMSLEIGNYDWMSYEILNEDAEYVFVPFGTGIIFRKILEITKTELSSFGTHDPRYQGSIDSLRLTHFLGATSNNPNTAADKLYSPFLPFPYINEDWIKFYKRAAYCGPLTGVYPVEEDYVISAHKLATELGVSCEASGSAGLGLLLQLSHKIPKDSKILIVNTGKLKLEYPESPISS
jgi:hypothetical protein